ncbi:helix-turn-helix domain-containing protein [Umezawaea endophytica]|uniref:Helix-turn-helix domain-containing protein n=1 Tax=Umezawaea endophytica TaxID=1654476 RepID=A0A9X2VQH5_9PSEU|nr:helix-turn-helix domain-containing protein [Umezawaea endophytica]MCS7479603.1 helix-turn-helix domain-containing protein [Umezawaea endophytica]
MSAELYSVEQVAEKLGLHVRTVRNYVRDGRLKAVRIGKQYRIAREDLDELVGQSPARPPLPRYVEVSSVVRVDGISARDADRVVSLLMAMVNGPRDGDGPLRVETMHDPERFSLKIIVLGSPDTTSELLKAVGLITGEDG